MIDFNLFVGITFGGQVTFPNRNRLKAVVQTNRKT